MTTKELILKYWKSWQSPPNWEETRQLMTDDFQFDAGVFSTNSADELITMMKNGNPWVEIVLLDAIFEQEKGALIYEGVDSITKNKFRVSEIITIRDGKILSCIANITQLNIE